MHNRNLVSVIITTYGRTDFLARAIQSVMNQSYQNIEIIVIDDNANNIPVRNAVKKIVQKYPKCRLLINNKNLGGSLSRNEGIKVAYGDFISFLDDDDTYESKRIERCIDEYYTHEEGSIGLVYTYVNVLDARGKKLKEYRNDVGDTPLYDHMMSCKAATSQWFCPYYIFEKVGMFEESPCKQDAIMLLKILVGGYQLACVKEALVNYTEHDQGRISGISEKNIYGLKKYHMWCEKNYHLLTHAQMRMVEASFAKQFITMYVVLNKKGEAWHQLRILLKNAPFSKWCFLSFIKCLIGKNYLKIIRGELE